MTPTPQINRERGWIRREPWYNAAWAELDSRIAQSAKPDDDEEQGPRYDQDGNSICLECGLILPPEREQRRCLRCKGCAYERHLANCRKYRLREQGAA